MEQNDFMNEDFELFDTDLGDKDLYEAVEAILAQNPTESTNPDAPDNSVDPSTSSENVHFNQVPMNPSRFVSHEPLDKFLEQQQNTNTKRKTTNDIKLFQSYLASQDETRLPVLIPPAELSTYISGFLLSVRRKYGEEFEPTTLRSFFSSINRHLTQNGYKFPIVTDIQFRQCRDVLSAKSKQLKSLG